MKRLAPAPFIAALLLLPAATFSAEPPTRPPGVAANNWVPVNDRLGIVLVQSIAPVVTTPSEPRPNAPGDAPLMLRPPVGGYFMVRLAGGWTRLVVIEPVKGPADVG